MKYGFSRFSTVSCFMERAISSRIALITMSLVCAKTAGRDAAATANTDSKGIRISVSTFKWRWKQRDTLLRFRFLLNFDLRDKDGRRRGGNRYASRFSSAETVKYGDVLVSCDDLAEGGQRRADQVGS